MAIMIEPSGDPALREQYYRLRERCYRAELGLTSFDGSEELQDRQGLILLAHEHGRCLGGARITRASLTLATVPDMQVPVTESCVWERFALDPETTDRGSRPGLLRPVD